MEDEKEGVESIGVGFLEEVSIYVKLEGQERACWQEKFRENFSDRRNNTYYEDISK